MKTVDILAKHLPKWDSGLVRIFQGDNGVFYGVYASDELPFAKLNYAEMAGLELADDAGIRITQEQWEAAKQELRAIAIDEAIIGGTETYDGQLREKGGGAYDKYQAKLQTLSTLLSRGDIPRDKFSDMADGISDAFDKIKL